MLLSLIKARYGTLYCQQLECQPFFNAVLWPLGLLYLVPGLLLAGCINKIKKTFQSSWLHDVLLLMYAIVILLAQLI